MAAKNIDMIEMQIDALVKAGYYRSISDITKSAFRVLLESKSDLKVASAVELYKMGKIYYSASVFCNFYIIPLYYCSI